MKFCLFVLLLYPAVLPAQTGVLVVAHGADSGWNARVRETVAQVHWDGPVATAFLMGDAANSAGWDAGIKALVTKGAQRIVVVPLMVSTFGGHVRQIEYYAGVVDAMPTGLAGHDHGAHTTPPVPVRVTGALDDAPELTAALEVRWGELGAVDRHRPVLLVAHGPNDSIDALRWLQNLDGVAHHLGADAQAEVRVMLLRDDAPDSVRAAAVARMRDTVMALARRAADSVVVMPVMISSGTITRVKIPRDLEALPIRYHPRPLAPLPELARWIERQAREGGGNGGGGTNGEASSPRHRRSVRRVSRPSSGAVELGRFRSLALGADRDYFIYLPPEYQSDSQRRFPVVYLLHGYLGDEAEWITHPPGATTKARRCGGSPPSSLHHAIVRHRRTDGRTRARPYRLAMHHDSGRPNCHGASRIVASHRNQPRRRAVLGSTIRSRSADGLPFP